MGGACLPSKIIYWKYISPISSQGFYITILRTMCSFLFSKKFLDLTFLSESDYDFDKLGNSIELYLSELFINRNLPSHSCDQISALFALLLALSFFLLVISQK